MRSIRVALVAAALTVPLPSAAQSGAATPAGGNPGSQDTTTAAPKKHGGLFGKVKGLAKNQVVQQVAKTAACNMVPGGQMLVGAMDKGSAKDAAKDAAKGAAVGAAAGLAGGKNPCMPGLMGNANPSALTGGLPGAGVPGMPTVSVPGAAISAEQMKQMEEQYRKMGMNPAQIQAMQQQMIATPGAGLSPEQIKQMQEQYRKMGMNPAQVQAMQAMMTSGAPGAAEEPAAAASPIPAQPTAGPTQPVAAPTLTKEKGRLVLHQLPWALGTEEIQPGAESAFVLGVHNLAAEIIPTAKHYTVQVRVEDQGSKAKSQQLAQKRAAVVVAGLVGEGVPQNRITSADGGSDQDPRVVVSESKATK